METNNEIKTRSFVQELKKVSDNREEEYPVHYYFLEDTQKYDIGKLAIEYNKRYNGDILFGRYHKPISKCI